MKVVVEERHIKAATPCDEHLCPVALAICEQMTQLHGIGGWEAVATGKEAAWEVLVGSEYITIIFADGSKKTYETPWEISEIIDDYDRTGVMYPFGFELS